MNRNFRLWAAIGSLAVLVAAGTGCQKLKARDHLNKGVQAYKAAKYAEAVEHFNESIKLDPSFPTARLYLATAYMNQWIPGADSPENKRYSEQATSEFQRVLEGDPKNTVAIASIASINYNQAKSMPSLDEKLKQLGEARNWYQKLVQADPNDKVAYYSLGVITWEELYSQVITARQKMGMKPEEPGPLKDAKVRQELKAANGEKVEAGIGYLQKSIQIDPEYDDAMAYLNLMLRIRADLQDTAELAKADSDQADQWVQKSLETKKIKAARAAEKAGGGIVLEEGK